MASSEALEDISTLAPELWKLARLREVFIYSSLQVSGCGWGSPLCRLEFMGLGGLWVFSYQTTPLSSGRLTRVLPNPHTSAAGALPTSISSHMQKYLWSLVQPHIKKKCSLDPGSLNNSQLPCCHTHYATVQGQMLIVGSYVEVLTPLYKSCHMQKMHKQ